MKLIWLATTSLTAHAKVDLIDKINKNVIQPVSKVLRSFYAEMKALETLYSKLENLRLYSMQVVVGFA